MGQADFDYCASQNSYGAEKTIVPETPGVPVLVPVLSPEMFPYVFAGQPAFDHVRGGFGNNFLTTMPPPL